MDNIAALIIAAWHWVMLAFFVLCLVVGVAIYPLFLKISQQSFVAYHNAYTARIGLLVGPLALFDIGLTTWLVYTQSMLLTPIGFGLFVLPLMLFWLITAFHCGPCHQKLQKAYHEKTIKSLCVGHWVRTLIYGVRVVAVFAVGT